MSKPQSYVTASLVSAALIFSTGLLGGTSGVALAKAAKCDATCQRMKKCDHLFILCKNACRNGTTLPLGSSDLVINQCEANCDHADFECMYNKTLTITPPTDSGKLPATGGVVQ